MSKDSLIPVRGMRDFYPEDFRARELVFDVWKSAAITFGYEMYDAPVVEPLELLERKAGEEISEQTYTFEDKSGRKLALRPEMTPSLARMISARLGSLSLPAKWSTIAQCFRYERMTAGRKREHYQWNLDVVGEPGVGAEVDVIATAACAMRTFGLWPGDYQVRVNSRPLLAAVLWKLGVERDRFDACCTVIDKFKKVPREKFVELLSAAGFESQAGGIVEFLESGTLADAESLSSTVLSADVRRMFDLARDAGIRDLLVFDPTVVRGLNYYTGIVFEAFDVAGKFRAIFGGGRYDNLIGQIGGSRATCVGLGFGDVVVSDLLASLGKSPDTSRKLDYAVGFLEEGQRSMAVEVSRILREDCGRSCATSLAPESPKRFFDRANKMNAVRAVFLGPEEAGTGQFKLKDMRLTHASIDVNISTVKVLG